MLRLSNGCCVVHDRSQQEESIYPSMSIQHIQHIHWLGIYLYHRLNGGKRKSAPEYLTLALRGGGSSTHFPSINTCPFVSAHPFFVDTAPCSVAHGVQRRTALTVPPSSEVRAKHNYVCRPCQTHYTLVELSYLLPACRLRVIYYPLHTPLHTDTRTHITTHAPSISNWAEDIYVPLYTYIQKSFQK